MTSEHVRPRDLVADSRAAAMMGQAVARMRTWLPPVDRREFWAVQFLVVLVAALHFLVEYQHLLDDHSPVYLLPTTLFLIPVVYAALSFGRRGAVLTALWAAILVAPNVLLLHNPAEAVGELTQVAWITAVAIFVGGRVDRERSAREDAEYREERRRDSEERYRAIVNNVGEPILVLDVDQRVIEANESAAALFGDGISDLRGDLLGGDAGATIRALVDDGDTGGPQARVQLGKPSRWYEPFIIRSNDAHGFPMTQILLVDVTVSTEREQGLEGITRRTISTREEERRRISRELHDGPLQSLIALWRDLDTMSASANDALGERLLRARAATEGVADELRRFSRDLRPSVLDDLGIASALRAEAERIGAGSKLEVRLRTVGIPRRLGTDTEITLLRIAQEALRNVARHAGASTVSVTLDFGPPGVSMRVADDGTGLDPIPTPSELLKGSHLGLIGMRERARMAGGSVLLRQASFGGLELVVDLPEESTGEAGDSAASVKASDPDA